MTLEVTVITGMSGSGKSVALHALEDAHGRDRSGPRFGDRTLDIDIVLFDDLVCSGPGNLRLPRGELRHAFVLRPLAEIAPEIVEPASGRTLAETVIDPGQKGRALTLSIDSVLQKAAEKALQEGLSDINAGRALTLLSIAAVVIGGCRLIGGVIAPWGVVAGAVTLSLIGAFLATLGVSTDYNAAVQGGLLIAILALQALSLGRRRDA